MFRLKKAFVDEKVIPLFNEFNCKALKMKSVTGIHRSEEIESIVFP
jgi:hypothetical protein